MTNPRQHSIQRRMVKVIDRQLATHGTAGYILKMGSTKLRMVRSFITSFILEDSDGPIPLMTAAFDDRTETIPDALDDRAELQSENQVLRGERDRLQRELDELRGMAPNTPAVAELAARLDEFEQRTVKTLNAHHERFDTQSELRTRGNRALDQRIDQVVEIIGTRVEGLVNDIAVATDSAKRAHERVDNTNVLFAELRSMFDAAENRTVNMFDRHTEDIAKLLHPDPPAFPTGGASTAEAVAEAVLPVPQRGDRVQIAPNTKTLGGANLRQQWAVVIGVSDGGNLVQVELDGEGDTRSIPWIDRADIMEVRHAQ